MKERLALQSVFVVAQRHYYGLPAITTHRLAERLGVPLDPVEDVLTALAREGLLVEAGPEADAYVPSRDLELITVSQVIEVVRAANETSYLNEDRLRTDGAVARMCDELDEARARVVDATTLRELVADNPPPEMVTRVVDFAAPAQPQRESALDKGDGVS